MKADLIMLGVQGIIAAAVVAFFGVWHLATMSRYDYRWEWDFTYARKRFALKVFSIAALLVSVSILA